MSDDLAGLSSGDVRGAPPDPNLALAAIAGFDRTTFLDAARATFLAVKQAVEDRDLTPVAGRLGDGVRATLQAQVDRLLSQHAIHHFEGLDLFEMAIAAALHGTQWDSVAVRFDAKAAQYAVDEVRRELIYGNQTIQPFTEYWTFSRAAGAAASSLDVPPRCPNCGAPIDADSGPDCSYCGAALPPRMTVDWVVSAIQDPIDFQA